jgi:16S rRNA (uracil1498-N3)-methyltransferase
LHKFFVQKEFINENIVNIIGEDVKHIYKVLRLECGDKIIVNDTCGNEFLSVITYVDKQKVEAKLEEKINKNNESPINVYLFQGLPKSSKMDLIVQKGVELGIKEITPVITQRVVVKNEIGEFKKLDRWNKIALEACKQSKRSIISTINNPIYFDDLIKNSDQFDLIVVPYENAENFGIKSMIKEINKDIKSIAIIIGPEGGFEASEIETLKEKGAYIVTLGPRILRTETAGFVCTSILQYELGDMGGIL